MLLCVSQVYFESEEVHACIVTCGGLCPGLNTVIREIVCGLYHMYGVHKVLGIEVSKCMICHYNQTLYKIQTDSVWIL
jgi:6-phosphofructokinase